MSEHKRSKSGGEPPISRHPLFPAIVALWCGALFGVGSIAIPPALIERIILALGIGHVIPMAAPPLGATARILITLMMTGIGAVIGVLAARRLTGKAPAKRERRRSAAPAAEDVESTGSTSEAKQDEAKPLPERRRALAAEPAATVEEPAASREPAPASENRILNVAEFDLDGFDATDDDEVLSAPVASGRHVHTETPSGEAPPPEPALPADTPVDAPCGHLFEAYSRGITASTGEERPAPFAAPAEPSTPGFDLLPHMSEEADAEDAGEEIETGSRETPFAPVEANGSTQPAVSEEEPAEHWGHRAAERIAAAQLDDLSPIELLERLALAMAQRRNSVQHAAGQHETLQQTAEIEPLAEPETQPEPETAAAETRPAEPLPFAQPRLVAAQAKAPAEDLAADASPAQDPEPAVALPAALRPVNFGTVPEDGDEDVLPAYIPPRHIGLAPAMTGGAMTGNPATENTEDEEETAEDVLEEGYSSLLNLSQPLSVRENPTQQAIGTGEPDTGSTDEPVAIFPGEEARETGPFAAPAAKAAEAEAQQPPAQSDRLFDGPGKTGPEETEAALRSALAALQRMSGAA
ncbi:hypothetical protein [Novosphingobium beihaiensis]|uniref:Uncharacterized protein n=1 Tax=Novosphingobium beihaiensis TaxID=2930389 RepID=A0ABT0BVA0_9SPHN|nr:hypothetical protein [Novosphingobium beihaiensis]MCJ2188564.1 hypothetical protein [Novosphingobium beihaiensis]